MNNWLIVKVACRPESQIFSIERRSLYFNCGKMWHLLFAVGIDSRSNRAVWLEWIGSPFGRVTVSECKVVLTLMQCLALHTKLLVQPELAIALE